VEAAHAEVRRMNTELERRVKERTAQLEEANRELEAFTYSVSHDLRAPLRHTDGFAQLLRKDRASQLSDKARRYAEEVSESVKRMGRLIDDLLGFSRMGRGQMQRSEWNMTELVEEVVRDLSPTTEGRNIEWSIAPLPPVCADRAMIRQVWANLLSNAVKYTRNCAQAKITVGFKENGEDYEFFVQDNGAGFDMQYANKLFGVFQRLHRHEEFEGTGIGLANVRRIIHRHGGRTWAASAPGQGAIFRFTLPRLSAIERCSSGDEESES
jgi:light-regulated signal transduction histidine kinase (bacteriophytochrome)